ncbi:MAG: UDP-N-acetylmuramate--L-alanine ligase [Desulfobacteraceae bacterium 4572_130]|nr:MAG: UDP-N-acetylmuramate--L-alanine ligase [Desulfobacteraceae bacterium 4572_130]
MNLNQNFIPDNVKKIHMIAACGTGMGALACMLKDVGYKVTGSDKDIYPPISDFLAEKKIKLFKGFHKKNLAYKPDLVIVGNAVFKHNPEVTALMDLNIPFCSMPQALNKLLVKNKKIILVTGTHGKTTTASIMAHVLYEAGFDPSFMIGGILNNFNSNYRIGKGNYIVIEGDEYDTAFFDKGPKFMHFNPFITIITSVEFDHADIFKDLNHVKNIFKTFIKSLSKKSLSIVCDNDKNLKELVKYGKCAIEKYGKNSLDWCYQDLKIEQDLKTNLKKTCFKVKTPNKNIFEIKTSLMGKHNILNCLGVIAAAKKINISNDNLIKSFKNFLGIKKRQEIKAVKNGITIMDDFAHHPTSVKETINAVKPFFSKGRIIAVFEPRTNSSMRNIFQTQYALSFDNADIVCICRSSRFDKIPSNERLLTKKLVSDICARKVNANYFKDANSIIDFLCVNVRENDLVLIMSNGNFNNIHEKLIARL